MLNMNTNLTGRQLFFRTARNAFWNIVMLGPGAVFLVWLAPRWTTPAKLGAWTYFGIVILDGIWFCVFTVVPALVSYIIMIRDHQVSVDEPWLTFAIFPRFLELLFGVICIDYVGAAIGSFRVLRFFWP